MFPSILLILIIALISSSIALLSVQNATLVSLKFFTLQTVQIPIGVLLTFCFSLGTIGGIFIPLLFKFDRAKPDQNL